MIEQTAQPVYTEFSQLSNLRARAKADPDAALREVARHFESVYVQMMMKSMRDASFGDPLFDSHSSELYRDMFDNQIALQMTQGKGLGLAELLVQQLQQHRTPTQASPHSAANPADAGLGDAAVFIQRLSEPAEQAAQALGIDSKVLLAQSALETGWGRHVIRHPDGRSSFNLFNIKADSAWSGKTVEVSTVEYTHGRPQRQTAVFRAYDSYAESFQDYVNFMRSNPRYRDALEHSADAEHYIRAVHNAGYATDPRYADKWQAVLQRNWPSSADHLDQTS